MRYKRYGCTMIKYATFVALHVLWLCPLSEGFSIATIDLFQPFQNHCASSYFHGFFRG